jgi:poly(A) polymerase
MGLLSQIEPRFLNGALQIVETLHRAGFEALFAGGMVRDLLLGRPVSDIDVTTSAPPETIERLFDHTIPVGKQFGVVIVIIDSVNYEVATFRKEFDYQDGRHPGRVEFTSAQEDSMRRDFTINALMLDPRQEEVIDFVGGRRDLENRIIRTVGDAEDRFREDKLRLMRAIRFACELDFQIEDQTKRALKAQACEIRQVSQERIRDELLKTLVSPRGGLGLEMFMEAGLLQMILPEVAAMAGVEQPPEFHPEGDVFVHTCLMLTLAEAPHFVLALGILLHDVGKPPTFQVADRIRFNGHADVGAEMAEDICRRLRVSREDCHRVVDLVKDHLRFMHVQEMRESTLKRFLRKDHFDDHLELHRLDCLASHKNLSNYEFCCRRLKEIGEERLKPELVLGGHDLIELGFSPGPIFSEILSSLEDKQLEGEITERQEALEWVRAKWPPPSQNAG